MKPALALLAASLSLALPAHAGLFDDDEARKAILDLRTRVQQLETQTRSAGDASTQQLETVRRGLLELNTRLEAMQQELATLRGQNEELRRAVAELERLQKDANQAFDDRLRKLEPQKVALDGVEFSAGAAERKAYDDAIATLRAGQFGAAATALQQFLVRWPTSGYLPSAHFWLGNALYGQRDYKGAIEAFKTMVAGSPDHPKAPEALLALANSQAESKDTRGARKTLQNLLEAYPQSEAAQAGKERLAALK